jgi:mono/diheme cytochrome c family protein
MLKQSTYFLTAVICAAAFFGGCRGMRSSEPPVRPQQNMFYQESFGPQRANPMFADGSAQRPPVPGTVKRGNLRTSENAAFYQGRSPDGALIPTIPVGVTQDLVERGLERYNIFCAMCHGYTGDGRGIIMVGNGGQGYGYAPAPTFHSDYLRDIEDGHLYEVITNGIRNMPSYAHQVNPTDRWAIVAYIRALQRSQAGTAEDIPDVERQRLRTYNPNVTIAD